MMAQKRLFSAVLFMGLSVLGQACSPASKNEISPSNLSKLQSLLAGDYIGKTRDGEVYHSIVKLNVPWFGGDIFYHHISLEALRGPIFQRKVYAFQDSGPQMRSTVLLGPAMGLLTNKLSLKASIACLRRVYCGFQMRVNFNGRVPKVVSKGWFAEIAAAMKAQPLVASLVRKWSINSANADWL